MDTLEDTRGIPSHGLFQHEQKARWTCVCWSYRRRLNWIFSYKSNDVATEAGVPVSVNSNWTSVPKLPQPKCLAAKGLKTFSLRWQCRLAIGHIQVPATGQPAGKTERNYPSQLQFNNSIKPLARYQVSLATPPKWIADQRERERERMARKHGTRAGSRARRHPRILWTCAQHKHSQPTRSASIPVG